MCHFLGFNNIFLGNKTQREKENNNKNNNQKKSTFNSNSNVDEIEELTGFDFFSVLPDEIENVIEAESNLAFW